MKDKKIAIIGGGNLGSSIAYGLLASKLYLAANITVTRRKIEIISDLADKGLNVHSDNLLAIKEADIVIVAVKPKMVDAVLHEAKAVLSPEKIVISVATGVKLAHMQAIVGSGIPVFRAMPNTAISIRESMTCIATANGHDAQIAEVLDIFNQLGQSIKIAEELMDASTVLAACGIAYALRFIRAASQGGIEIGFDAATAQTIASQTVRGAAGLLIKGGQHPEREIDKVTTPAGITIAGLNEMEHQGFSSSLIKGIKTSFEKIG
ncbi:MAG: pyrroline-5-carboxylate reductase [Cyclobacteriaceae bacterium]|nr:pyrroline-5-carboxylate reductase [Cyclobacteriaceae bacterium]